MPHSTRRKRPQPQKRLQITDDDGWTHITTGGNARRTQRKAASSTSTLVPAEAPRNLTVDELKAQFEAHRAKWEGSAAWKTVESVVRARAGTSTSTEGSGVSSSSLPAAGSDELIDAIVCIGLGSPSGFLKGGWVDRRSVSMYQLAAVVCIRDLYATLQPTTNPPNLLAQDPVFNSLDKSLLTSLDITILDHPQAFNLDLSPQRTLLYCPGAERAHLELLLFQPETRPALVIGGPLEDAGSEVLSDFAGSRRESVRIPRFEPCEHAFWGVRAYCA